MADIDLPMPKPTVPRKNLTKFKLLAFDIYATLINWEPSITVHLQPILSQIKPNSQHAILKNAGQDRETRHQLLRLVTDIEGTLMTETPTMKYDQLLEETYIRLADQLAVPTTPELKNQAASFGKSIGDWEAFPDTVDALFRLSKYFKLVPLSNVDRASFARTNSRALQGFQFWRIYTAEDIGSYKPDLRNFEYLIRQADLDDRSEGGPGIAKEEICSVAQALSHDHVPAKKLGISSVWIDRKDSVMGVGAGRKAMHDSGLIGYGWRFATLGELADEVEKQAEQVEE